jgi:RNA polymerase sigma factor (sigma-70 family)
MRKKWAREKELRSKLFHNEDQDVRLAAWIAAYARQKYKMHQDVEDLIGYTMLGVLRARKTYDPTRGVKFSSYAWKKALGYIKDMIQKESRFAQHITYGFGLAQSLAEETGEAYAPEYLDELILAQDKDHLVSSLEGLEKIEALILRRQYWLGHNAMDIGKDMNKSKTSVCRYSRQARQKLREVL